jgi:hypothetical protein
VARRPSHVPGGTARRALLVVPAVSAGTCTNCGKHHQYLLPLHGERGGPLFCPICAGMWNAKHTRRRKWGRIIMKAMRFYEKEGGRWSDFDKMKLAIAGFGLPGFEADTIGAEVGDITSELLADTIELTHPDRHPPERKEMAQRVTQELLALKPFVLPAPPPLPPPVPRNANNLVTPETLRKPLPKPTYPCELCCDTVPFFYCNHCKAEWERRREVERDAERVKRRRQASRRRERKRMMTRAIPCAGCDDLFKPPRKDARYCSAACRQRAHRQRVTVQTSPRVGNIESRNDARAAP